MNLAFAYTKKIGPSRYPLTYCKILLQRLMPLSFEPMASSSSKYCNKDHQFFSGVRSNFLEKNEIIPIFSPRSLNFSKNNGPPQYFVQPPLRMFPACQLIHSRQEFGCSCEPLLYCDAR